MRAISLFLARRIGWAILVSAAAAVMTFLMIRLAPGNPVSLLAGEQSTPEFQAELAHRLGLDQSLAVQLWRFIEQLAHADLGYSFTYHAPVTTVIGARIVPTLILMGTTLVLSIGLGMWIGVRAAVNRGSRTWGTMGVLTLIGYSLPAFWLGQVLILVFSVRLGWFPALGMTSDTDFADTPRLLDIVWHLALPVATVSAIQVTLISRLTRAAMVEALGSDYVVAARGKGIGARRVVYRHALRNALLPVVTVIGLELGWLIAGFVVVETVFSWPGLGSLTAAAIDARDYPVITGLFLVITLSVVLANLLTDLVYLAIDPRIRVG